MWHGAPRCVCFLAAKTCCLIRSSPSVDPPTEFARRITHEQHDCEGASGPETESDRCGDPAVDGSNPVPLHDLLPRAGRDQACREASGGRSRRFGQGGSRMTAFTNIPKQVEDVLEKWNATTNR